MRLEKATKWVLLVALAVVAASAPATAQGWFKDLDDVKDVELGDLLQKPRDYMDVPVRMKLYFNKKSRNFNPYTTRFSEDVYDNFSAWPYNARLYEKRDFQRAFSMFFVPKHTKMARMVTEVDRMKTVEVVAVVRDVFRGQPWIEVISMETDGDGLSEKDVRNVVAGDAYFHTGRYKDAVEHYRKAIDSDHPTHVRADILRRLGDAYYYRGRYDRAADSFKRGTRLAPKSEVLRQGLAASEESRNLSRLKRRGKAAPEAKLRPAPRSQSVYVDMSNDVDHIIAKFEDPAKVAAAVKAHDESIRARGEAARQKSAPVEEVEEAEAVEVAGEETPEAVTADGSDVVEDNVSCGEPESCGCAEPEGCESGDETVADETTEEPVEVVEETDEAYTSDETTEEPVEVVEETDEACTSDEGVEEFGPVVEEDAAEEQGGCADGCTEPLDMDDSEESAEESTEEVVVEEAEEVVEEATEVATEEAVEEAVEEAAEESTEGCASDETEEGMEEEVVAEEEACASDETADESEEVEEVEDGCVSEEATDEAVAEADRMLDEVADEEGADQAEGTQANDADEGAEAAVTMIEVPDVAANDRTATDEEILAAGKDVVLVGGKVMTLPRLPFFGCEAVTVADLHAVLVEVHGS